MNNGTESTNLLAGIRGVSFAGAPRDHTILYLGHKLAHLLENLTDVSGCVLFLQDGMQVPASVAANNTVVYSAVPVRDYARAAAVLYEREQGEWDALSYDIRDGATIGSRVVMGSGVVIEPGAVVGHGVVVGDDTRICSGAVIRPGVRIGQRCLIRPNAVIGDEGFTMAPDEDGNPFRLHCLAGVELGDDVEIGAGATVCRGQSRDTVLERFVKVDDHAYLAHDVHLGARVVITAGVRLGGFVTVGADSYIGMGAVVKQLLSIGSGCTVGMGSVVTKGLPDGVTAYGIPARIHD